MANNTYYSPRYRFSIQLPDGWKKRSGGGGVELFCFSPRKGKFKPNLNIMVKEGISTSVEKYAALCIKESKPFLTDYTISQKQARIINGLKAYELVQQFRMGEFKLKTKQLFIKNDSLMYLLTFTCRSAEYKGFESAFEKCLKSFKLDGNQEDVFFLDGAYPFQEVNQAPDQPIKYYGY
jgi:hypothetical protein